jgi:hypothetical protein
MPSYPASPKVSPTDATLFQVLDLNGAELLTQSLAWDPATGEVFMAKAVGTDTHIFRFSAPHPDATNRLVARRLSEMVCVHAGHGSTIAVWRHSDSLDVILPWDTLTSDRITQRDVAYLQYGPGRRSKSQATILHVFTDKYTVLNLDPDNDLCVLRVLVTKTTERLEVRRWTDVRANRNEALFTHTRTIPSGSAFQGVAVSGRGLFVLYGKTTTKAQWAAGTPNPVYLYQWDWTTGALTAKWNLTRAGQLPGDARRSSEPESVNVITVDGHPAITVAFKMGSGGDGEPDEREIRLINLTPT